MIVFVYPRAGLSPDDYQSLVPLIRQAGSVLIHAGLADLEAGEQPQPLSHQVWMDAKRKFTNRVDHRCIAITVDGDRAPDALSHTAIERVEEAVRLD